MNVLTTVYLIIYLVGVLVAGWLIYRDYAKGKENKENFQGAWIVIGSITSWITVIILFINREHCRGLEK